MLEARDISKRYGKLEVLRNVSLSVDKGEIVAIVGTSGAGKSTLLHILGTLEAPDTGEILLSNVHIHKYKGRALARLRNQKIGFVFQYHQLLPEFTALENVCLPAYIGGSSGVAVRKEATRLLERLGVANRMKHLPSLLSGGEAQRVAVARALINRPNIVYADEPSGNLDSTNAEALYALFLELSKEQQQSFLIVTHNEKLASAADRSLRMADGSPTLMSPRLNLQEGVGSMLVATFCFVCMKVFVKLLPRIPLVEIIMFRAAFTFVFSYTALRMQSRKPWGNPSNRHWLLLRGAGGVISLLLYFYLIQRIPLASAYAIQYLVPIFTSVIALLWIGERIGRLQWALFLIAFIGVLMVQGFDTRVSLLHLLLGVTATLFMSFTYVIIRRLRHLEHPLTIVFYFSVVALPVVAIYVPFNWVQPQREEWIFLLLVALFTQAAQYYSVKAAFAASQLSKIASVSYVGIVFAIFAGFLFGEYYELRTYLGMAVVTLSVAASVYLPKT